MEIFSWIAFGIFVTFLAIAIIMTLVFGEGNFERVEMTGPF